MGRHSANSSQTAYPWRATARTILQAFLAFCCIAPFIVDASGLERTGLVAAFLTLCGAVTRVMALPVVNDWLLRFVPFLAAEPKQ
jgi:hypothetical protein